MRKLLVVPLFALALACAHSSPEVVAKPKELPDLKPKVPGQSLVVVYRNVTGFMNAGAGMVNVTLLVDQKPVGDLSHDTYGVIDVGPGRHVLTAKSGMGESNLIMNLAADSVSYVQMETAPAPKLSLRDAAVARGEIATDCTFGFREAAASDAPAAAAPAGSKS